MTPSWPDIERHIGEATGQPFAARRHRPVGGGSINHAYLLESGARRYFVKLNQAGRLAMFEAEAEGLEAIAHTRTLRVPAPVCHGVQGHSAYLVLEYLELGRGAPDGHEALGRGLAAMHRATSSRFGWHRDNTIGSTEQVNAWSQDWCEFWRDRRLGFQLRLLAQQGVGSRLQRQGERLLDAVPALLAGHYLQPSLLHGDLWSGNHAFDAHGAPVIFDPAVYYGDREAEIAMTELFGGFSSGFYQAYEEAWPLEPGYTQRKTLYNLYHVLNHVNLFGGSYLSQAERMIERLLAEV